MKTIETEYNGYRFQSRLEARWAVFFDKLGIKYEYDPEGIILSDETHYFPSFYLPTFHCYFVVKRNGIQNTPEEEEAIREIRNGSDTMEWAGIIAFGDPMDDQLWIYCQETDSEGGGGYEGPVTIGMHPRYFAPCLLATDAKDRMTFYDSFGENMQRIPMYGLRGSRYKKEDFVGEAVLAMRKIARQARFENGERPGIWEGH